MKESNYVIWILVLLATANCYSFGNKDDNENNIKNANQNYNQKNRNDNDLLITKELTEYYRDVLKLDLVDYEDNIFKGWTIAEVKALLNPMPISDVNDLLPESIPTKVDKSSLPSSIDWTSSSCDHGVRDQGKCASCYTFSTSGMISDRCCLSGHDHGWLSPQEILSCDKKSSGCSGGWPAWAMNYVINSKGIVPETCFPYKATNFPCLQKCQDGKEWEQSHVCNCTSGYRLLKNVDEMKEALKNGPITAAFAPEEFYFSWRGGSIYTCGWGHAVGIHSVLIVGYSDSPQCYFVVRESFGTNFWMSGYSNIGCHQCGIDGKYANGNLVCDKVE